VTHAVGAAAQATPADVDGIIANDPGVTVTDIAYLEQAVQPFSVDLSCDDGRQAHGIWTGPVRNNYGILTCGLSIPDSNDDNQRAILIQATYCV